MMKLKRLTILLAMLPLQVVALQPMADDQLSGIAGRDGISIDISSNAGWSAGQMTWVTDDGGLNNFACAGGVPNQHACTRLRDVALTGQGGPLALSAELDVGTASDGHPYLSVQGQWGSAATPVRLELGGLTLVTPAHDASNQSLGEFALISHGSVDLVNRGGLFNSTGNHAYLDIQSTSDLIYRQGGPGAPELSLADMVFNVAFTNGAAAGHQRAQGRFSLDPEGIAIRGPFANVDFTFDLAFKAAPMDFDQSGRRNMMRFGWQGGW